MTQGLAMQKKSNSLLFSVVTVIVISLSTSSCSRIPKVTKSASFRSMKSGLVGMKNTVVRATPKLFKRKKTTTPVALPLKGYPTRLSRNTRVHNTRSVKKSRYPVALPLRRNNSARTCPVPNNRNRVVLAQRKTPRFVTPVRRANNNTQQRTASNNTVQSMRVSHPAVSYQQPQAQQRPQQQPQARTIPQNPVPQLNPQQANQQLFNLAKNANSAQINQLLNQGANVNASNASGETALHSAASTGNISAAQALLQRGANVNARTVRGWTPLHTAARFGRSNLVALLLRNGAQPNTQNIDGKTPMQLARQANQHNIVAQLQR